MLDFITKSFVFNESDTEQELEEAEPAVEEDKEGHDIEEEEEEEEDGKEFVAKVGGNLFLSFTLLVVGFKCCGTKEQL